MKTLLHSDEAKAITGTNYELPSFNALPQNASARRQAQAIRDDRDAIIRRHDAVMRRLDGLEMELIKAIEYDLTGGAA